MIKPKNQIGRMTRLFEGYCSPTLSQRFIFDLESYKSFLSSMDFIIDYMSLIGMQDDFTYAYIYFYEITGMDESFFYPSFTGGEFLEICQQVFDKKYFEFFELENSEFYSGKIDNNGKIIIGLPNLHSWNVHEFFNDMRKIISHECFHRKLLKKIGAKSWEHIYPKMIVTTDMSELDKLSMYKTFLSSDIEIYTHSMDLVYEILSMADEFNRYCYFYSEPALSIKRILKNMNDFNLPTLTKYKTLGLFENKEILQKLLKNVYRCLDEMKVLL